MLMASTLSVPPASDGLPGAMQSRRAEHAVYYPLHPERVVGENSAIEWTDHTFNPWWGCTKVSPGCDNCYAEAFANRLMPGAHLWDGGRRTFGAKHWAGPIKWNRKAEKEGTRPRVFCSSMADVFDKDGPMRERLDLWDLIEDTPHLDWLLLTKRVGNVPKLLPEPWMEIPAPNVWLGITVVNQEEADRDIPKLLRVPAAVRFLSCEPLLEMISLDHEWLCSEYFTHSEDCRDDLCALNGDYHSCVGKVVQQPAIDWIIAGGESGPGARPMNPDWPLYLKSQCEFPGTAFFMKQGSQANWPTFKDFNTFPPELQVRQFPRGQVNG